MDDIPALITGILALSPFVFGLLLFVGFRFWVSYTNSIKARLEIAASRLRQLRTGFRSHQRLVYNLFSDEEPYKSRVANYRELVVLCESQLNKIHSKYMNLRQEINHQNSGARQLLNRVVSWKEISTRVDNLHAGLNSFETHVNELDRLWDVIDNLSWEVAQEIQLLNTTIQMASEEFRQLAAWGWRGELLDRLHTKIYDLTETLRAQVPIVFLSPDPSVVLANTNVLDVIRVHRVARSIAEQVGSISKDSSQLLQEASTLPGVFENCQKKLSSVQQIIADLESAKFFPLRFDNLVRKQNRARNQATEILHRLQGKFIENLLTVKNKIASLDSAADILLLDLEKLEQVHKTFTAGALSEEVRNAEELVLDFKKISGKVSQYHLDSFDRGDHVQGLDDDIKRLQEHFELIKNLSPLQPITESEIYEKSQSLEAFRTEYALLRPRVESVRLTLEQLAVEENNLIQDLETLLNAVNYLATNIVPVDKSNTLKELKQTAQQYIMSLADRGKVSIAGHKKKKDTLRTSVTKELHFWFVELHDSIAGLTRQLRSDIDELCKVATFNDPILGIFNQIESEVAQEPVLDVKAGIGLDELMNMIAQKAERLRAILDLKSQLNTLAGQVLELNSRVEKRRKNVESLMQFLLGAIPEEGFGWPPTAQRFTGEDQQALRLDNEFRNLRSHPSALTVLEPKLQEFETNFRTLEMRLEALKLRVDQDQIKFFQYLKRYDTSKKMWEALRSKHKQYPIFANSVEELLSEAKKDLNNLEKACIQGHFLHHQALQNLRNICKRLDENQVDYDENRVIDINGYIENRR